MTNSYTDKSILLQIATDLNQYNTNNTDKSIQYK